MKLLTFTAVEDENGHVTISTHAEGFNGNEIIGILESKKLDIIDQMCGGTKYIRTRKFEDGSVMNVEDATDEKN